MTKGESRKQRSDLPAMQRSHHRLCPYYILSMFILCGKKEVMTIILSLFQALSDFYLLMS
ncbi:hypothetical protein [Porphyromonas pogonae]|uniref:hypothetical protein n=1 Tax=Porphyromonas pogonae TaxID=867595 RepID=UPI002E78132E|nr:hypothetical protein [Porphyromonas pogonae]